MGIRRGFKLLFARKYNNNVKGKKAKKEKKKVGFLKGRFGQYLIDRVRGYLTKIGDTVGLIGKAHSRIVVGIIGIGILIE